MASNQSAMENRNDNNWNSRDCNWNRTGSNKKLTKIWNKNIYT